MIGVFGSGAMWFGAEAFCNWIGSEGAFSALRSISPGVFFVCVSSAIRGYFQGFQRMLPTALSQLIESLGKLIFGLLFAFLALESGEATETVAAAAGWGLTLGSVCSTCYLMLEKARASRKRKKAEGLAVEKRGAFAALARLAIPMTIAAALTSLTKIVDMTMILRRLQSIGYSEGMANEIYGSYTTLAISVFSVLPTLLNSVSLPLVPILSSAVIEGNRLRQKQMIETSYRLTALFAIPASLAVTAFAEPMLMLIFPYANEAVEIAAPLLSLLGGSVFFSSMITATNSILHAYGAAHLPILSMGVGIVLKVIIAYFLIGEPQIGISGAPISSFFCNGTIVLLNFIFVLKLCKEEISIQKIFFRPFAASLLSVGASLLFYRFFTTEYGKSSFLSITSFVFCLVLYFGFSALFGCVTEEDLCSLPLGDKIYSVLKRLKSTIFKENRQKTGK